MFIELTDMLRCPGAHEESYLVLVPDTMDGRRVVRGTLGCPECRNEYPIVDGVAEFGTPAAVPVPPVPAYDADALTAFLDLQGRGGYVALCGTAARYAHGLAERVPGVHVTAVNAPGDVNPGDAVSMLRCAGALPFKTRHLRAVVLGADCADAPWVAEAVRVLLPGLRLVIESDTVDAPGTADLARGAGILVAERLPG